MGTVMFGWGSGDCHVWVGQWGLSCFGGVVGIVMFGWGSGECHVLVG